MRERVWEVMYNIDLKETGLNIKRLFDMKGYSIKDIQDYLGLACPQSIYKWINGEALPTLDHLYDLSKLLRISIDDFLIGEGESRIDERTFEDRFIDRLNLYYFSLEMCA